MNGVRHTSSYYQSLTRKMILVVIVVSLTPMILVSGMILGEFKHSYTEKAMAHLSVLVQKHKIHIDSFLDRKLKEIQFLVESFGFEQLQDEIFLQNQLGKLQKTFNIVFYFFLVINHEGVQVAYAGTYKLLKAKYSDAEWFNKAITRDTYISDVFLGLRGLPHFIVSVKGSYRGKPCLLRATIDFMTFNHLVENLRIGETGFAFIVNREGRFQTKPVSKNLIAKNFYEDVIRKNIDTNEIYIGDSMDSPGLREIIFVSAFLKNGDWIMVCQQDRDDAFSDFGRARNIAVLIIIMGGLVIITMAVILSGLTVSRISKADREKEMMNQQMIETGKLASVGELAAGIAHEINNPVAIIDRKSVV